MSFDSIRLKLGNRKGTVAHQQNLTMLAWYCVTGDINALS